MEHSQKHIPGGILSPFLVRDFRLLFGGQTISTLGDAFYAVALPWLVLTNGGTAQELGIVLMTYGLPRIATVLLGGMLSDRFRPRRVMLLADFARALLVGALAVLGIWGHPTLWQLCLVAAPLGAFEGLFLPASYAMMPEVLDDNQLQAGNALNSSSLQLSTLLGSGIAGIVVGTLKAGVALAIDALSFLVSAIALVSMRNRKSSVIPQVVEPINSATEGVTGIIAVPESGRVVRSDSANSGFSTPTEAPGASEPDITFWQLLRTSQLVQGALVVVVVANLTFGGMTEVALPALAHGPLAAGASGFGLMLAAYGAGALLGGLGSGLLGKFPHRGLIALLTALVQSLTIAAIPFGGLVGAIISLAAMGACNSVANVLFLTIMQQQLPRHLLGRIMGVFMFASFGSYPLSVLAAGFITARFGPVIIFPLCGASLMAAIVFGLCQRELREL